MKSTASKPGLTSTAAALQSNLIINPLNLSTLSTLHRLQPYSLTIKYRQGADIEIAVALSRLSPQETEPISDMDVQIHEICPQFSSGILQEIRAASATDPELK